MRQHCYRSAVPRSPLLIVAWLVSALFVLPARASVNDPDPAMLFEAAEKAEASMNFGESARLYRELLDVAPSSFKAPRARARAEDLEAHAEGEFRPLARLEAVRRDPALAANPEAIAALEEDAEAFPPGRVRAEARLLSGTAWLRRFGEPSRAIPPLSAVVNDTQAEPLLRRLALGQLIEAHRALGDISAAKAEVDAFPDLLPDLREAVHREARRAWIMRGAISLVALVLAIGALSALRLARASGPLRAAKLLVRPVPLLYSAWLAGMGALLARGYDASDPTPFLLVGASVLAITTAARAWSLAQARALVPCIASPFRAALSIAAIFGAAFLALLASDSAYLDTFGL